VGPRATMEDLEREKFFMVLGLKLWPFSHSDNRKILNSYWAIGVEMSEDFVTSQTSYTLSPTTFILEPPFLSQIFNESSLYGKYFTVVTHLPNHYDSITCSLDRRLGGSHSWSGCRRIKHFKEWCLLGCYVVPEDTILHTLFCSPSAYHAALIS
jgi:hypothetical protein